MTLLKFHSQFCFSYGAFTAQRSCKQVLSTSIRIKLTSDNYHCDSQLCCQCQHHVSQRPKYQQPQKNVKIHTLLLLFTTLNAARTISRNFFCSLSGRACVREDCGKRESSPNFRGRPWWLAVCRRREQLVSTTSSTTLAPA